jgi:hypothetical protein
MFKKARFTLLYYLIAICLIFTIYFVDIAARATRLNLAPLFASVCFGFALILFIASLMIRYFLNDSKKIVKAENIVSGIFTPIILFFALFILNLIGVV